MNGAKILDLGLLLVFVLSFFTGFRRGLFVTIFGLVGYYGGAILAITFAPQLFDSTASALKRTLITGLLALFFASIGSMVMTRVAGAVRKVVLLGPFKMFDSALGGVVSTLSIALVVWFLATLGNLSGSADVSSLLKRSAVVQQVDRYMPGFLTGWVGGEAKQLVTWFRSAVPKVPKL